MQLRPDIAGQVFGSRDQASGSRVVERMPSKRVARCINIDAQELRHSLDLEPSPFVEANGDGLRWI
jgi:hypothetical protein